MECIECKREGNHNISPTYTCSTCQLKGNENKFCSSPPVRNDKKFHGEYCKCCDNYFGCYSHIEYHCRTKHKGTEPSSCFPELSLIITWPTLGNLATNLHSDTSEPQNLPLKLIKSIINLLNYLTPGFHALYNNLESFDKQKINYSINQNNVTNEKILVLENNFFNDSARIERFITISAHITGTAWLKIRPSLSDKMLEDIGWKTEFFDHLVESKNMHLPTEKGRKSKGDFSWVPDFINNNYLEKKLVEKNDSFWSIIEASEIPDDSTELINWLITPSLVPALETTY